MAEPVLSVIMGVYNCPTEEMLMRAVDSVLEQTFSDLEFIICDDGSDNGTYEWLKKAAQKDKRIVLIRNKRNMSLAYSLNRCIEIARGKYIARQDADDYSVSYRFEKQLAYLSSHSQYAFVGSNCLLFDSNVYGDRKMPQHPKKIDFLFNSPFIHGSVMFRREVFDSELYRPCGYSGKYEDYDLFMRLYRNKQFGANLDEELYAFYADMSERRVPKIMRFDEAAVRYNGFKELGLLPFGFVYVIKPFILAMLPNSCLLMLKRRFNRI